MGFPPRHSTEGFCQWPFPRKQEPEAFCSDDRQHWSCIAAECISKPYKKSLREFPVTQLFCKIKNINPKETDMFPSQANSVFSPSSLLFHCIPLSRQTVTNPRAPWTCFGNLTNEKGFCEFWALKMLLAALSLLFLVRVAELYSRLSERRRQPLSDLQLKIWNTYGPKWLSSLNTVLKP